MNKATRRDRADTPIRAVLFDLDGTLLDTAPDFVAVLNQLLARHGRAQLPFARIREKVSEGARALVSLGFGIEPAHRDFDDLHQELLNSYLASISVHSNLFSGMEKVLTTLESASLPWGVVTNKPNLYTEALLQDLQLSERCAVAICPDHVTHRKPHPEPIHQACQQLGCNSREVIYVGDHRRDIEAGNNADSLTLAANWGYAGDDDPPHQWGALAVIERPEDILDYLSPELPLSSQRMSPDL